MKKLTTIALIAALVSTPVNAPKAEPKKDAVLIGCAVIIVGGIIIYGLYKICKMLPPTPPRNPPATNQTHQGASLIKIDGPLSNAPALLLPDEAVANMDQWQSFAMAFQSSTNLSDWRDEYSVTNWANSSQAVSILYSNSLPLATNFAPVYWTNDAVILDFSGAMTQSKDRFWRAVQY